ncbi:unnamed protein product [Heterobilharzia americana]|nr:unnamed protein product [Heterobilharzia americana]
MSRRKKTFLFIPYELTEHDMLRNASKSNSIFYSLGYTIHSDSQNSAHDDVVLILGFYNSSTESEQLCSSCCMKVDSTDFLHICAKSLRKYNFHHSCIQRYYPLSNSNDTIWYGLVWI